MKRFLCDDCKFLGEFIDHTGHLESWCERGLPFPRRREEGCPGFKDVEEEEVLANKPSICKYPAYGAFRCTNYVAGKCVPRKVNPNCDQSKTIKEEEVKKNANQDDIHSPRR